MTRTGQAGAIARKPRGHLGIMVLVGAWLAVGGVAPGQTEARGPNILLIVADDLGYGDLGCYHPRAGTSTPHLDRLASGGMRLLDAHAPGAVCVPSRYGLLTGDYPWRNRRSMGREGLIAPDQPTIATVLRDAGYDTAMVGKWHQGFTGGTDFDYAAALRGGPVDHGFGRFFGMHASLDIPPYFFIREDRATAPASLRIEEHLSPAPWTSIQGAFWRGGPIAPDFHHEEVLGRFKREAIASLEERAATGSDAPFFLYLALAAPHTPWLPSEPFRGTSRAEMYGDFVAEVDAACGEVLGRLEQLGLAQDTLVVFTSDNGPVWYPADVERTGHSAAGALRGMKGDAFEGGHRMPFVVRWPGHVPAGATSDALLCFTDLIATFAALARSPLPDGAAIDSVNQLPVWLGESPGHAVRNTLVVQTSGEMRTVRVGPWKLIPGLGSGGFSEPRRVKAEPGMPAGQLYNLAADLAETQNLYGARPDQVKRLQAALETIEQNGTVAAAGNH